ncbi:MAG: hypothetical protein RIQ60_2570 [Pseudomonadota bacterium]|jgi:type IV pilus assembly protein PilW
MNAPTHPHRAVASAQRGATLIELMVGVVIGLLAVLVIAQVALVYEGQKRSTTSGSDAQVNGALALQTLHRDVQMGGYGLTSAFSGSPYSAGCTISARRNDLPVTTAPQLLVPVLITDGANGATDTVQVLSSGNRGFSVPVKLGADHGPTDSYFTLQDGAGGVNPGVNIGNTQGDLMLAIYARQPPNNSLCTLFGVNVDGMTPLLRDPASGTESNGTPLGTVDPGTPLVEAASAPTGTVAVGRRIGHTASTSNNHGLWNVGTPLIPTIYKADATYLINLGRATDLIFRSYSTDAGGLFMTSFNADTATATTQSLYANIVTLQAVYGKALGLNPQQVTDWNTSDPALDIKDNTGKDIVGWTRVIAVRIAVVARSQQFEKGVVTPVGQPVWHVDGIKTETLKVDTTPDWQHYRYKVFETVVPLRNMIWQS